MPIAHQGQSLVFYGNVSPIPTYVTVTSHGQGYTTVPQILPAGYWQETNAIEGTYDGEHWKTEEAISIDSPDGTSSEYRRAVDACALARSRLDAATRACTSLGAGLYALRPPLEDVGLVIGEVDAWRAWRNRDGTLKSVSSEFRWNRDGVTQADAEPKEENQNGLWAFKTRELLENNFPNHSGCVLGRVKMWGKIVEHEFGYRAQYAKIEELLEEKRSESYEFIIHGSPTDTTSPDTIVSKPLVDHYKQVRMLSLIGLGIASVVIILNTIRLLAVLS